VPLEEAPGQDNQGDDFGATRVGNWARCKRFRPRKEKRPEDFSSGPSTYEFLVRLAGIEPTTPWFVAKYSIQLSYSRERQHYSRAIPNLKALRGEMFDGVFSSHPHADRPHGRTMGPGALQRLRGTANSHMMGS
jgi:hypothetical protein